jgi:hypothetical protein
LTTPSTSMSWVARHLLQLLGAAAVVRCFECIRLVSGLVELLNKMAVSEMGSANMADNGRYRSTRCRRGDLRDLLGAEGLVSIFPGAE